VADPALADLSVQARLDKMANAEMALRTDRSRPRAASIVTSASLTPDAAGSRVGAAEFTLEGVTVGKGSLEAVEMVSHTNDLRWERKVGFWAGVS
jgi:hypothetical protein